MTRLYVDGQIVAITIESGHTANVDIYSTAVPKTKYIISDVSHFVYTEISRTITDDLGYSTTPIMFTNTTGANIIIKIQAFEDAILFPDSSNVVEITVTPKGVTASCPKGDWYVAPFIGDCDPGYSRQLFGNYCICDKGITKPPTDYITLVLYAAGIIGAAYIAGKLLDRGKK